MLQGISPHSLATVSICAMCQKVNSKIMGEKAAGWQNISRTVPEKISGKPLPDLTVHSPAQENPLLSAMDILFYIRLAYFSASFFLPDNNGSYPQASGYRESGCSRLQTVDKLGAGHNPQHQVCLQPEIPAFISWYFFIVKDSEIKR